MGEKAVWDKANVKHFCDICREEVLAGHRPLGHLKKKNDKKRKAANIIVEEKEEKSPFLRVFKQTCSHIEISANKIASSVEASAAPPQINQVPTIKEAMSMVKECGVEEGTDIMHPATFLIMKPEFREVFGLLETNTGRLHLLKKEHDKEMRKMT